MQGGSNMRAHLAVLIVMVSYSFVILAGLCLECMLVVSFRETFVLVMYPNIGLLYIILLSL